MQSTMMILTTLLAAGALASPFPSAPKENICNKAPSGPKSGDFAPFAWPHAITADLCHLQCQADRDCQCFVFGFPASAQDAKCMLFRVPGWQVPGQEDNLHVFDRDCSGIPAGKPSREDPMGEHQPFNPAHQGPSKERDPDEGKHTPTQYGVPPKHDGTAHLDEPAHHDSSPNHNGPKGHGGPVTVTTTVSPPAATHAPGPQDGGHHQRDVPQKCGGAPAGPMGNESAPAPMRTDHNVASEQDCLSLCKKIDGCKAVEFGKPSAQAINECRLFSVEANKLPAPGRDQSFTAFDSRC